MSVLLNPHRFATGGGGFVGYSPTLEQDASNFPAGDFASATATYDTTPTSGNLLVAVFGFRDEFSNNAPGVASISSGWTLGPVSAPMEWHLCAIAWKVSAGTESSFTFTPDFQAYCGWMGIGEFAASGVSSWAIDTTDNDGSNTSNVSSIDASTGALDNKCVLGVVVGASRTSNDGISFSGHAGLTAWDDPNLDTYDANQANFGTAFWAPTDASSSTITCTESTGSSRMGIALATWKDTT